jgi:hypothetical protein
MKGYPDIVAIQLILPMNDKTFNYFLNFGSIAWSNLNGSQSVSLLWKWNILSRADIHERQWRIRCLKTIRQVPSLIHHTARKCPIPVPYTS